MGRIVVIGSTGQLGSDLMRVFGPEAIGLAHPDVEITDEAATTAKLHALRPGWVLNTAAFNRVDDCETDATLAFAVNAIGALNVSRAAAGIGAGVVFFSTDYVFGGDQQRRQPYAESDTPEPLNVYGASKCAGEQLVRLANPRHLIIRTAGLFGQTTSRKGWTFPELMLQKARTGEHVRVVHDQILTPTYSADLAAKVKELIERGAAGLFHVANAGACSWFDFTAELFRLANVSAELTPITTGQSERRARRPAYSALTSTRLQTFGVAALRPWQDALRDYLGKKGELR
jgi:dTDP-4-dehydrorhamnose reductase